MKDTEILNVYFYALYDEGDGEAHSGLTANMCSAGVRSDIAGNYITPRYVTVHRVPGLVAIAEGSHVSIKPCPACMEREKICCETCHQYGDCLRSRTEGMDCCPDWEAKS